MSPWVIGSACTPARPDKATRQISSTTVHTRRRSRFIAMAPLTPTACHLYLTPPAPGQQPEIGNQADSGYTSISPANRAREAGSSEAGRLRCQQQALGPAALWITARAA